MVEILHPCNPKLGSTKLRSSNYHQPNQWPVLILTSIKTYYLLFGHRKLHHQHPIAKLYRPHDTKHSGNKTLLRLKQPHGRHNCEG